MGWRTMNGIEIYEEDGRIKRCILNGRTAYPYIKSKRGGWDNAAGELTYKQLSDRIKRETAKIM